MLGNSFGEVTAIEIGGDTIKVKCGNDGSGADVQRVSTLGKQEEFEPEEDQKVEETKGTEEARTRITPEKASRLRWTKPGRLRRPRNLRRQGEQRPGS